MSNFSGSNKPILEESILSFHLTKDNTEIVEKLESELDLIEYENTYRMESRNPFDEQMVMKTVQNEVEKHFNTETNFNSLKAMQLCETLTNDIIDIIFDMKFERYKIVCRVEVVENKNQGLESVTRFLRDYKKDKYVNYSFENKHLFVTVLVAGIYHE